MPRELPLSQLIHDAYRLFQQAPPAAIFAEAVNIGERNLPSQRALTTWVTKGCPAKNPMILHSCSGCPLWSADSEGIDREARQRCRCTVLGKKNASVLVDSLSWLRVTRTCVGADVQMLTADSTWLHYPYNFQTRHVVPQPSRRRVRAIDSIQIVWGEMRRSRPSRWHGQRGEGQAMLMTAVGGLGIAVVLRLAALSLISAPVFRTLASG